MGKQNDNTLTMFNKDQKPSDGYKCHDRYKYAYVYYHNLKQ